VSNLSRVGTRTLALLAVTTILGIGLQTAARAKMAAHPDVAPPDKADQYQVEKIASPLNDRERDFSRTNYRMYFKGSNAPIYVSITRAETLNCFRAPYQYLMENEGRMLENRKNVIPRIGEKEPVHLMEFIAGRDKTAFVLHWAQNWGGEPIADPLTLGQMFDATIRHEPVYIVDVWTPFRSGSAFDEETVMRLAAYVDRMIKEKRLK
jgi:hypothetical protein